MDKGEKKFSPFIFIFVPMFASTNNKYSFLYLITGITGSGISHIHLPEQPNPSEILFKEEQKFIRPEMPEYLAKEIKKWRAKVDPQSPYHEPGYISPFAQEIKRWEQQEWDRCDNGIWFWNNGTPTYITGFYYFYLSAWQTYFGFPIYRETDKEITYFLKYAENDPDCYGILLNTIRRYGKSSLMGAWGIYRTINNKGHYCGMQGEKDSKIALFYNDMILKPFKRLPYFHRPIFDTSTAQKNEIRFEKPTVRGKKAMLYDIDGSSEELESVIDYRPSGEAAYDGSVLHTYIGEEPGKVLECNVYDRWKIVRPCLRKGRTIRGKSFMGTTVEFMDVTNKGGKAYKNLFYKSDVDDRGKDGRTVSGLYACFLPGDTAYEDFLDEWGHPKRDEAKTAILDERESVKDNPKDYSDIIRKYPLYVKEIFYINSDKCVFNATILQERLSEINMSKTPLTSKFDLYWENGVRFSKVKRRHNPVNGWFQASWIFEDEEKEANLIDKKFINGSYKYFPKNQAKFAGGLDPVDHGIVIEEGGRDEEVVSTRRSKPVLFVKRKYDSSIDGVMDQELMEKRARDKFQYKTNRYIGMMDSRPNDPNVTYERVLLVCWYFGMEIQVETQKPGVKNWFHHADCEGFLQQQYVAISETKKINPYAEGTAASSMSINEYTEAKATFVEYFGHTIDFRELIEDDLVFNPKKTTLYDYSVAGGWTELACKIAPKFKQKTFVDLESLMPMFDREGNRTN